MTDHDYLLIACRADKPIWAVLEIPADIAEDIDAANWMAGTGLKDATARREVFRAKRAQAKAEAEAAPIKTGFDHVIAEASNYSCELVKRIDRERQMAVALVTACIDRGFMVSLHDGEEWVVKKSTDAETVLMAMFSTDEDSIRINDKSGKCGWFQLIYGNDGYDVVADYGVNDVTDAIWNEVLMPLSDKLEAAA